MHAQRLGGSATPETAAQPAHPPRRVTSFRSRRSSLNEAQQDVWNRVWPTLGRQAIPAGTEPGIPVERLDVAAWFGRSAPPGGQERSDPGRGLVCEIGCGTGTSTLAMARSEPDVDVIAVEVYRRGLAQLLSAIDREAVPNIRLLRGDGLDVLEHLVGPGSLTGVRVFFPDPWPKSRHHKRRLLQRSTIALIADRLRPGGVLHVATDHAGYAGQIAEAGDGEPALRRAQPGEALPISVQRPTTKYEEKARVAGNAVTELVWVRRP
jgi:tRNA (guanine-N7-)-methyltransferase